MNYAFSSITSHRTFQRALTLKGGHLSHDNSGMKVAATYKEIAMEVATYTNNLDIVDRPKHNE